MSEKKKVKLLRHGTALGQCGDVVELPAHLADEVCKPRQLHDGYKMQEIRIAKPADEPDLVAGTESQLASMTQAEAEAAGIKNVVKSDSSDVGSVSEVAAQKKSKAKK